MAYIDNAVNGESILALTRHDAAILQPYVTAALKRERQLVEKYRDLHEGGGATERETDLLIKHEEMAEVLASLDSQMIHFR